MSGSPERRALETGPTLADTSAQEDPEGEVSLETVDPSHYVVDGDIAQGGMGIVRQALDKRTGRRVALKELLGDPRPRARRRFEREARIAAQLQHPSIVPVYEIGQWPDGRPFFAMKLVGGRPFDVVVDEASDAEARLALIPRILPAVEAIAYAHEKGIIHRDLKPANVLLGEFQETVVIDWGLAKGIGEAELSNTESSDSIELSVDDKLTREGAVMGTPAYMPPEQARAETLDPRADVYSLGALLYHALSGHAPYESNALRQLLAGPPVPLATRAPNAPPDLVSIIEKAMARDREDRYADAGELAHDLEAFQTGRLVGAYEYTSWELVTRFVRRNRALTMAIASLVVLSIVAVGFIVREQRVTEQERVRAVAAEANAVAQERVAHERLTQVHWQSAVRRFQRGDHLGAELLAAAAMVESPDHPRGPHHELRDDDGAEARLAGPATTWVAARALRFATQTRELVGHDDWIYDVLVSDDDRWLVTTAGDRRALIWNLRSGRVHRVLGGHGGSVFQAALDAESARLATSAYDGKIRIWSFPEGELLRTIDHPADRAYGVCFAFDGALLGAGGNGEIGVFDAESGALERTIDATSAIPWRLRCSRDEPVAVLSTVGSDAFVLDMTTGSIVRRLSSIEASSYADARMRGVDLTAREIITSDEEGVLRRFDRSSGTLIARTRLEGAYETLVLSPDERWIALGGEEITIIDASSMRPVARLAGHEGAVVALTFDSSGRRLFSGGDDRRILEWEIPETREGQLFMAPNRSMIDVTAQSPDQRWLAAGGDDASVRVWDARTGRVHHTFEAPSAPVRAAVFLGRDLLATAGMDRTLWLHDLAARTSTAVAALPHFGDELALSADGTMLAIASGDGTLLLRDQESGTLRSISIGDDRTWWTAFDPSGALLATASFDGRVAIIDAADARIVRRWNAHEGRIYDASWRPDGRELTTIDLRGRLRGWDPRNGEKVRDWTVLDGEPIRSVAWSPDGAEILVTTEEGARVYDSDGALQARLDVETATAAAWTPDGRIVFASSGRVHVLPLDRTGWRADPSELLAAAERDAGTTLDALMELETEELETEDESE